MRTLNVLDFGIKNDGSPAGEALLALFDSLSDHTEVFFPAGVYYLDRVIPVRDKNDLVIRGDKAVLMTHFSPWGELSENNNAFDFSGCCDMEIAGFTCTTDQPTNCVGRVSAINLSEKTYDVEIDERYPVTGWEHFMGSDTFDGEGSPDYVIETYDEIRREEAPSPQGEKRLKITGVEYTCLGDHRIRVKLPDKWDAAHFRVGHRVLYRYEIYGNSLFAFSACHRVALRHIEVERCASMAAVVQPRSSDFTFEDFNVRTPQGDPSLYAANADAIHILGLCGHLEMKHCSFQGLGDDALNIHGQAGEAAAYDPATGMLQCIHRKHDGDGMLPARLHSSWARPGDLLRIYDRNTFLEKGRASLDFYEDGQAHVAALEGALETGDILANDAYFASVHLEDCEVRHTRARGFLLQSGNMLIENCRIYGMSLAGILISPDIRRWYEMGPSDHVEIRNCVLEKCGFVSSSANRGAILVNAAHEAEYSEYPAGVHSDFKIHHNTFKNCGTSGIFAAAVRGIRIRDNCFENCGSGHPEDTAEEMKYDVVLKNCSEACLEENRTDKRADRFCLQI